MDCRSPGEKDPHDDFPLTLRHISGWMGIHVHLQILPVDVH